MAEKLLLVDDDANIREIAKMSLEDDWHLFIASSGSEAVSLAITERPDVIVLDRMMPGMDGMMTLEKLRAEPLTRDIPIIFLTAKVQSHEFDVYDKLNVAGVLSKPFDPMSLTDEIRKLILAYQQKS